MPTIKVKAGIRKGKTVKAHTRSIKDIRNAVKSNPHAASDFHAKKLAHAEKHLRKIETAAGGMHPSHPDYPKTIAKINAAQSKVTEHHIAHREANVFAAKSDNKERKKQQSATNKKFAYQKRPSAGMRIYR